jgi:hypothetical protein
MEQLQKLNFFLDLKGWKTIFRFLSAQGPKMA